MGSDNNLSLGEFLRQEREKRGMTIEQVASATKINVRLLHALEENQYKELPAKPFIRGFVTSYSRFVGLDPREVMTQFSHYIDSRAQERPNRESGHSGYVFEKREGDQNSRTILGTVMGILVLGGAVAILTKPSFLKHKNSHIEKLRSSHSTPRADASPTASAQIENILGPLPLATVAALPSSAPSSIPSASPSPVGSPSPTLSASADPSPAPEETNQDDPLNSGIRLKTAEIQHKVKFTATQSVWVRYQVDSRPQMLFVLKKGKNLILRAQKLIKFQVSNPEAITFSYNQAKVMNAHESNLLTMKQENPTFIFPPELNTSTEDPFPNEKRLSTLPPPRSSSETEEH